MSRATFASASSRVSPACSTRPRTYSRRCTASHAGYSSSRSGRSVTSGGTAQLLERIETGVRALADDEVAAVGDDPQLRAQAPGVLEGVVDRQLRVAGAPEHDRGARHLLEIA